MTQRARSSSRAGHTLLEVILALGLASLLVSALWVAIDLQLRVTDTSRTHLEQAQLARAILRRISDDLRSAVRYEPVDVQSLVNVEGVSSDLAASLTGGTGTGTGGTGTGTGTAGGTGSSGTSGTGSTASSETAAETPAETPATSVAPKAIPGIYGDRYGLQIDVSRLPRLDQYEAFASDAAIRDKTSDVKSVAYYLGSSGPTASSSATNVSLAPSSGGLVRRELDRAVTSWAAENGNLAGLDAKGEPLAPEVVALEFRYFDGTEWSDYWDSTEREGLPMAVDVALAIASQGSTVDQPWTGARTVSELEESHKGQVLIYRLLVHLPSARPTTLDATGTGTTNEGTEGGTDPAASTGDTAASGSSGSGSASNGTGGTGSQPTGPARQGKSSKGNGKTGTGTGKTGTGKTGTTPTGGIPTLPTGGTPTLPTGS